MHPADKAIRDMLREKDLIIKHQSDIIHAADRMHRASQKMPQCGSENNRELAASGEAYQAAKDGAKKAQEEE